MNLLISHVIQGPRKNTVHKLWLHSREMWPSRKVTAYSHMKYTQAYGIG